MATAEVARSAEQAAADEAVTAAVEQLLAAEGRAPASGVHISALAVVIHAEWVTPEGELHGVETTLFPGGVVQRTVLPELMHRQLCQLRQALGINGPLPGCGSDD